MREGRAGDFSGGIGIGFNRGDVAARIVGVKGSGIGFFVVHTNQLVKTVVLVSGSLSLGSLDLNYRSNISVVVIAVGVGKEILRGGVQINAYSMDSYHRRSTLTRNVLICKLLSQVFILRINAAAG